MPPLSFFNYVYFDMNEDERVNFDPASLLPKTVILTESEPETKKLPPVRTGRNFFED